VNQVKITLRNYRCFADEHPTTILIGPGFTAFVGQNNAGKSSLLKLFYELRALWGFLANNGNFRELLAGNRQGCPLQGVFDQQEIFCLANDRRIEIQFDWETTIEQRAPYQISRVILACDRQTSNWSMRAYYGPDHKDTQQLLAQHQWAISPAGVSSSQSGLTLVDCSLLWDFAASMARSFYIGPFRNAINEGGATYFDMAVGTTFVGLLDTWKAGDNKAQRLAIQRVQEEICHIFEFRNLEINASTSGRTLNLDIDNLPYKLHEMGAGLTQFIMVLSNVMVNKPAVILIDEPELNLHPALQIDFLTTLGSYASAAVVFATHSIGLARAATQRIFTFQRKAGRVTVAPFEQTPNYAEFLGEMSFSSFKEMGCDRVLLVEGVHDVLTAHQFLRKLNLDHKVVVLPLGGDSLARGGVDIELVEIGRLTDKISVLVDSERESEGGRPKKERAAFLNLCQRLKFDTCMTERRSIENYFSDQAVKAVHGEKYSALKPFERLRDSALPWGKGENWRIAREMSFEDIRNTDVGQFFLRLK